VNEFNNVIKICVRPTNIPIAMNISHLSTILASAVQERAINKLETATYTSFK